VNFRKILKFIKFEFSIYAAGYGIKQPDFARWQNYASVTIYMVYQLTKRQTVVGGHHGASFFVSFKTYDHTVWHRRILTRDVCLR